MKTPSDQTRNLAAPDLLWCPCIRFARYDALIAGVVVLFAASAWWLHVSSGHAKTNAAPGAPVAAIRLLSAKETGGSLAWREDLRGRASPVLFALPTPVGFDRGHLLWDAPAGPLPSVRATRPLPSASWPPQALARLEEPTLVESIRLARGLPRPAVTDTTAAPAPVRHPELVVTWRQTDGASRVVLLPVATNSPWANGGPWESRCSVRLDAAGWPENILIESTDGATNRDPSLRQILMGMNFGAKGPRTGELAIRYETAPAGTAR